MPAPASPSPAPPSAICRRSPISAAYATTRDYVEAGLNPHEDPNRSFYLLGNLGLDGTENPATLSGGEARRAALARTLGAPARYPAAG